jgi:hypothetical protein
LKEARREAEAERCAKEEARRKGIDLAMRLGASIATISQVYNISVEEAARACLKLDSSVKLERFHLKFRVLRSFQTRPNRPLIIDTFERFLLDFLKADFLFLEVLADGEKMDAVSYFPDGWHDVPWQKPDLVSEILAEYVKDGRYCTEIVLKAGSFARMCHIGADGWELSDNYFDLPAEQEKIVRIVSPVKIRPEEAAFKTWLDNWV